MTYFFRGVLIGVVALSVNWAVRTKFRDPPPPPQRETPNPVCLGVDEYATSIEPDGTIHCTKMVIQSSVCVTSTMTHNSYCADTTKQAVKMMVREEGMSCGYR